MIASDLFEPRRTRLLRWSSAAALVVAAHVCAAAVVAMHWEQEEADDPSAGTIAVVLAPMHSSPRIETFDAAPGPLVEEAKVSPQTSREVREEIERELPRVEPSPAPEPEVALPMPRPVDKKKPEEDRPQEEVPTQRSETQATAAPFTTAPPPVDAKAAPVAAAPAPGLTASVARVKASWERSLASHVNRHKRVPRVPAREASADVSVQFALDRAGHVTGARIVRSSGSTTLDREALELLQRASPLPAPPVLVPGETFDLVLPIYFRIK